MKRKELEHVLRAASLIVEQRDFLVVGSAAILGTYPDEVLPLEASRSEEADLAPFDDPTGEKSAAVEGSLGQLSPFHTMYGYYADGVDFATATAPDGWEERLIAFEPPGAEPGRGLCLEVHDLAASKLAAGRIKDFEFVDALLRAGLLERAILAERVERLPRARVPAAFLARARAWVQDWE
jgi:hypothetical protein